MSFLSCTVTGAVVGSVVGSTCGAYFLNESKRNEGGYQSYGQLVQIAHGFFDQTIPQLTAAACFISGPVIGAGLGGTYYALDRSVEYLQTAAASAPVLTIAVGVGIYVAYKYKLLKRDSLF